MGHLSWSGSGSIYQKYVWIRLIKLTGLAAAQKEWERQRKLNADKPRGTAQHDTMSDENNVRKTSHYTTFNYKLTKYPCIRKVSVILHSVQ